MTSVNDIELGDLLFYNKIESMCLVIEKTSVYFKIYDSRYKTIIIVDLEDLDWYEKIH